MTSVRLSGVPSPSELQDQYSEAETIARREGALRRMLTTPPKQQKEMVGQPQA
jgi:hypothetical protein